MKKSSQGSLVLKEGDYLRLMSLIDTIKIGDGVTLLHEIERADIVSDADFPANVVCMHARVTYQDMDSNAESTITLVYPHEADVQQMKISVLSPVGTALLGLNRGGVIDWPMPHGKSRRINVVKVAHQNMASG